MVITCKQCHKSFTLERHFNKHLIHAHKSSQYPYNDEKLYKYKCLDCINKTYQRTNTDMIYHLETVHGIIIEREELLFKNNSEFVNWKNKVEKHNSCKYVYSKDEKDSGGPRYVCCKPVDMKFNCISYIQVIEKTKGSLKIMIVKTHYGHNTGSVKEKSKASSSSLTIKEHQMKNEIEIMTEDYSETTDRNMKNDVKIKLDIVLTNLEKLNKEKLEKLHSCLQIVCEGFDSVIKSDEGEITIYNNFILDHNYFKTYI